MMKFVSLGQVMDFQNGRAFKTTEWKTTGLPIIRIQNLNEIEAQFNYFDGVFDDRILVDRDDLLFSWSGTVGTSFGPHIWNRERALLNQHIFKVKLDPSIEKRYAYYALLSMTSIIEESVNGAVGLTHITKTKLVNFRIPLPPLEEQQFIVEKLDNAFTDLNLLEGNLQKSEIKANSLLESLLSLVFSSGTDKIESSIPSTKQEFGIKVVKLSDICTFSRGLTYSKDDEVGFSGNVVLRANNIDLDSNSLNFENLRYIKDSIKIKREKIAQKNSLIICTASGSKAHVGKVALIDEDYGYAFGGFMGQLTPSDNCNPKFLYYVLTSRLFKDFLMGLNDGTNINNLKFTDIENYRVPLPTLDNQNKFINKLDSVFAQIKLYKEQIKVKKDYVINLRQSVLSSAFKPEKGVA